MVLSSRASQLEILDDGEFTFEDYAATMKQLELINKLTRGHALTIAAIREIALRNPGRPLRVLDVGFGYGDTLRAIARWARRARVPVELTGIDLNPWAKRLAEGATRPEDEIEYRVGNAFSLSKARGEYDVIINALFMHHLHDDEVVEMLKWMTGEARLAWFINDLHRHALPFHFIRLATRAFGFHPMIRNDAPLSVARSFRAQEWQSYLAKAHVPFDRIRIRWHWSFRHGVLFKRSEGSQ